MKQFIITYKVVSDIIASLFIFLFLYTAITKLQDSSTLYYVLQKTFFVPAYAKAMSIAIPVVELFISVLLFFLSTRLAGHWCTLVIMTIFTSYIFVMLQSSSQLPCSCGGILNKLSWRQHVWLNTFLILLSIAGIFFEKYRISNHRVPIPFHKHLLK